MLACASIALGAGASPAGAASFQFAAKADYAVGEAPNSVAAGDVNGDGKADLVTADSKAEAVSVLINKGDGTFQAQVPYPAGKSPVAVALADVNGDGKPDLVAADSKAEAVSVLINKGDGTFETQVEYATGETPVALALADVNGDGKADIVTADAGANTVSVLINKGDGTFEAPKAFATGEAPAGVALADTNGDGKQDIVAVNAAGESISVLLGKGDGTFETQKESLTAAAPAGIALADLNGDKKPDAVAANRGSESVSVLLGKGDGTFEATKDFTTGNAPVSVAVADLNADGKPDIAAADSGANTVSVLLGKGDGTFAAKQDLATGAAPAAAALSDLNGDGKPDIATANTTDNTASALLNTSVAVLEASPSSLTFPGQLFGTKSAAQKVTVTNTGSAVLPITSVAVTGNFASSGCTGSVLPPGASCPLSVTFSPKGYGALKGEATIASGAGSKVIKLSGTGLPPAGIVTTGAVSEIVGSYVTLTGSVVSQGPGTFSFQYGPSTAYGSATPVLPLASSSTPQLLTATLSLAPGRTYHYRLSATNLLGTVDGVDKSFTVPPEAPSIKVLRHGRLRAVLKRGLRLRVSDTSPARVKIRIAVGARVARAAHLIAGKRKGNVVVATARVSVSGIKGKTVIVHFSRAARRRLAGLKRLSLSIVGTASTASGVNSEPAGVATKLRR